MNRCVVYSLASKQDVVMVGTTEECSTMATSLAISGDAPASGVTQFANEACTAVEALSPYVPTPYTHPQVDLQDIKTYFQRPRLFGRGPLAFASRVTFNSFDNLISQLSSTFPQMLQRLSGVYGVRYTLCGRLQVAATAFHQGVLALSYQYASGALAPQTFDRGNVPAACTNLPHVRLDLSETTMVELRAPFLYANEFVPLATSDIFGRNMGHFSLSTILPIISVAGLAAPTYEFYVWLEDMELFGADNNASTVITLQAPSVVAKELRSSKLLSNSLDTVSKVAAFAATHVPLLSGVLGPTAWATDIAAGVARYFGFSKPLVQDPVLKTTRFDNVGEGQVDVPFSGLPVGPFMSNTLAFDGVTGATDVDEMSLKFVTSQFSQICIGSISTTNVHGDAVYSAPVSPSSFWFRASGTPAVSNKMFPANSASLASQSGNAFLPSSLMNVSSLFRMWRGDIIFRFTFAKTKFHGGRYMVSFNPSAGFITATTAATTTVDGPEVAAGFVQPYGYSKIMDMRDTNVFEFVVPYASEQPYVQFMSFIGAISVVCIDPLQASASVCSTVPFMVEVAGGDNFELADYSGNQFVCSHSAVIYQQSGEVTTTGIRSVVESSTTSAPQHTIGEQFTSLKQVIMLPCYAFSGVSSGTTVNTYLPPWHYYSGGAQVDAQVLSSPLNVATVFRGCGHTPGYVASMYAFARGSTDYHVHPTGATPGSIINIAEQIPAAGTYANTARTSYQANTNTSATPKVLALGIHSLHIRLPAYQSVVRVPIRYLRGLLATRIIGSTTASHALPFAGHGFRLVTTNVGSGATIISSCSAGDDATLSCYLGPEPVIIPNAASASNVFPDFTSPVLT